MSAHASEFDEPDLAALKRQSVPVARTALDAARARPRTLGEPRPTLLRGRGVSLAVIAREVGRDLSGVSRVNHGQRRSDAIEQEIARQLGLPVAEAFPEWRGDRVSRQPDGIPDLG